MAWQDDARKVLSAVIESDVGLDPDTYAAQKSKDCAMNDETAVELALAHRRLDYAARGASDDHDRLRRIEAEIDDVKELLVEAVEDVVDDAIHGVEVGDYIVDLDKSMRHDCPACGERTEHYYLGNAPAAEVYHGRRPEASTAIGWVCGYCEVEAEQLVDSDGGEVSWSVVADKEESSA